MKGDFTRFTYAPEKHYTRVLKQQGRVDLDADWNELVEILTQLDRSEVIDVIGRCGVPESSNGFKIEKTGDSSGLTVSRGRIYVDGILCSNEAAGVADPIPIPDLPAEPDPGNYLVYLDVWERHITHVEDDEIREVALGGPDTTTRTRTVCQVGLEPIDEAGDLAAIECRPFAGTPSTGALEAWAETADPSTNPCVVPAEAGYTGLENRLYRVEIHDDGRDADGNQVRPPTFKWSRDNGSVVLPIADDGGIDGVKVKLKSLGPDEVLTVKVGDWVEVLGDETELALDTGTLVQVAPKGIDKANREITLAADVSAHAAESHPKLRRWDHDATDDVALVDGALPIQGGSNGFELEDGVRVRFDTAATYNVGDYWVIPARTREGKVEWPRDGAGNSLPLPRLGILHHYCTLALVRLDSGAWSAKDCRPLFPPLTEVDDGCCCLKVEPGDDLQQAIDTVIGEGGGCISMCRGVHRVSGPLRIANARDLAIHGVSNATVLRLDAAEDGGGGLVIESSERVTIESMCVVSGDVTALVDVRPGADGRKNREIVLRQLTLLNLAAGDPEHFGPLRCGVRLAHADGVGILDCRIVAEAGVTSLWGGELPEPPAAQIGEGVTVVGFEELGPDDSIQVGESLTDSGVTFVGEPFLFSDGTTGSGSAGVFARQTGQGLFISNVLVNFALEEPQARVRLAFEDASGGAVNLRINGDHRSIEFFSDLNGVIVGGARLTLTGSARQGLLQVDADSEPISDFAIGGLELLIDDLTLFRDMPSAPESVEFGDGVTRLVMRDTEVRFAELGVFAGRAERWELSTCALAPAGVEGLAALGALFAEVGTGDDAHEAFVPLLTAVEDLFDATPDTTTAEELLGTALLAFLWRDSRISSCALTGLVGAHVWWWIRGGADGNTVVADDLGLFADWLHAADWTGNRVTCDNGLGLAFAGSYRARLAENRVRALVGLTNIERDGVRDSLDFIAAMVPRAYAASVDGSLAEEDVTRWLLAAEMSELLGLSALFDTFDQALADLQPGSPPALFLLGPGLLGIFTAWPWWPIIGLVAEGNDIDGGEACVSFSEFAPLGSLRIADSQLRAKNGQAVRIMAAAGFINAHLTAFFLRTLIDLGLEQLDGLDDPAPPFAAILGELRNLFAAWREGIEAFLELDFRVEGNTVRSLRTAIELNLFETAVSGNHITLRERPAQRTTSGVIFGDVLDANGSVLPGATVRVDSSSRATFTDAEGGYRFAGLPPGTYTLRVSLEGFSSAAATVTLAAGEQVRQDIVLRVGRVFDGRVFIADRAPLVGRARFNLSDSVLANNAVFTGVTLFVPTNSEIEGVMAELESDAAFEPLAVILRDGAATQPALYAGYLLTAAGPLGTPAARAAAAGTVAAIGGLSSDAELQDTSTLLAAALQTNDETALPGLLTRFIGALHGYVDSQGILARAAGCRIVDNQVLVPADTDPETEALGGIQVSVNFGEALFLLGAGLAALNFLGREEGGEEDPLADPLWGITESLIDNNEVTGGAGHGISVQGVAGLPDVLADLRVRGNQVRGLAGTGVLINEHAFVVGLDVEGNKITNCGRDAGFTATRGGVVIRDAAVCRVAGNRILRCGQEEDARPVTGLELDLVYGLELHGNEVLANGRTEGAAADDGGAQLTDVYAGTIHDNVFSFNRGRGFSWINSATAGEDALLPLGLVVLANLYLRTTKNPQQVAEEEQASIQDNVLRTEGASEFPLFDLMNLAELIFSGNTLNAETTSVPLGEIKSVTRGLVAQNLLTTNAAEAISIKKMLAGVVMGNVGNKPIDLQSSPAVQKDLNVPPAT